MKTRMSLQKGFDWFFTSGRLLNKLFMMTGLKDWSPRDTDVEIYARLDEDWKGNKYVRITFYKDEKHIAEMRLDKLDHSHFSSQTAAEPKMAATDKDIVIANLQQRVEALTKSVMDMSKENSELRARYIAENLRCNRFMEALGRVRQEIKVAFKPEDDNTDGK